MLNAGFRIKEKRNKLSDEKNRKTASIPELDSSAYNCYQYAAPLELKNTATLEPSTKL
jgi:hypothetical protein